jgi:putative peptidoglycan lipid II flippase
VPNLVRGLFADAAISAAFVPVFTELLEKGKRKRLTSWRARCC